MTERARIEEAVAAIRRRTAAAPEIGVILGSGLGALADGAEAPAALAYGEIPHFPVSTAAGHRGRLVLGRLEGRQVALMQGRVHVYEGYTAAQVAFPVRVLAALGARTLVVTNAAGGINRDFQAGDLMIIRDHINFSGTNPLIGPNEEALGPRFPDMSRAYDPQLAALAVTVARDAGVPVRQGVYVGVSGPSYETPAELEMMARWGADAVGMSTVPEVIAARHAGARVLGLSAITNVATAPEPPTHEAVLQAARALEPRFVRLVRGILRALAG
ncbi:MAG TPA: purine-nucleoside phosphorylase [bacterium]